MTRPDSDVSFKATANKWQKRANERRENNAKKAGVASSTDYSPEYMLRKSNVESTDKVNDKRSSEELDRKKRKSQMATRMSHPNEEFDISYHEPIKVRFATCVDKSAEKSCTI